MEIRLKDVSISVDDLENRKIGGYINVTNRESEVMYSKQRGKYFKEVMNQGVFQDAITTNRSIPLLLEHDYTRQLADTGSGTLELREDNIGLRFDAVIKDDELYQRIKDGKINSCSFGFSVLDDRYEPINPRLEKRFVNRIRLDEVSLVSNPAYIGSLCETRALEQELRELEETQGEERKADMPNTTQDKKKKQEETTSNGVADLMKADLQMDVMEDEAELQAKKKVYGGQRASEVDELMKKKAQMEAEEEKMDMAEDEAELQAKKKMLSGTRDLDTDLIRSIVREVMSEMRAIEEERAKEEETRATEEVVVEEPKAEETTEEVVEEVKEDRAGCMSKKKLVREAEEERAITEEATEVEETTVEEEVKTEETSQRSLNTDIFKMQLELLKLKNS